MESRPIIIDCDLGLDDAIYWQIPVIIGSDHPLTGKGVYQTKEQV